MSLAKEIEAQNTWFYSKQDAFYSWFKDSGKDTLQKILSNLSEERRDGGARLDGYGKYILDVGEYSFLLVGADGSVDKLSQTFDLSEENTNLAGNEVPVCIFETVWREPLEEVHFFPASDLYDFPLIVEGDETDVNPLFLSAVDEVYEPHLDGLLSALSEVENGEIISHGNALRSLLISNLAKVILPRYYTFPWADIDEEFADPKEPYLLFSQKTFSIFSENALNMTKGELADLVEGEESENCSSEASELEEEWQKNIESIINIEANTSDAHLAACVTVMVCDNELDDGELTRLVKIALSSELIIEWAETMGSKINEIEDSFTVEDYKNVITGQDDGKVDVSDDLESREADGVLNELLEDFDANAVRCIIENIRNAWETAQESGRRHKLLDLVADKIGPDLSSFVLGSCLDIAKADGVLKREELFILAHYASKWGQEDYLCKILHAYTDRPWSIITMAGKSVLIPSDKWNV